MDVRTRSKNHKSYYGYTFDLNQCNKPDFEIDGYYEHLAEYERVESVRGKPRRINVGPKVVDVFNPFQRFHVKHSVNTTSTVCVPAASYIGTMQNYPGHRLFDVTGAYTLTSVGYGTAWDGDMPPVGLWPLVSIGNGARNFVIRDLFAKANAPEFNVSVFFAELDETLIGIKDLLTGSAKFLIWNDGRAKTILKLLSNPQDLWLWYRYALLPTMLDVEEIIKVINSTPWPIDRVQTGSRVTAEKSSGTFRFKNWGYGRVNPVVPWTAVTTIGCGSAMDILAKRDPAKWGTSAMDVLSGAWERLTLSFILDWFINVGDWLASLRDAAVEVAQSYATYAVETSVTYHDGTYKLYGVPTTFSFYMSRITNIEPPKFPLIDKRWRNLLRTIDAISLILGAIKGALRRRQ